jgi:putative endonuclease
MQRTFNPQNRARYPGGPPSFAWNPRDHGFQAKDVLHSLGEGGLFFLGIPSYGWQAMFYTYLIESLSHPDRHYIGHTSNLRQRLVDHNARKCSHTSKFIPWKIKVYVAFETIERAQHFEQYLKSGSGHAFAKRHF